MSVRLPGHYRRIGWRWRGDHRSIPTMSASPLDVAKSRARRQRWTDCQWYGHGVSPLRLGLILAVVPLVIFGVMGVALLVEGDSSTARSTFAAGVIATTLGGTAVIYQVDRWRLSFQTVIHFAIILVTVLPAMFWSGWFTLESPVDYLAVIGIFLVTGLVIWLVMFVVFGVILPKRRPGQKSSTVKRNS